MATDTDIRQTVLVLENNPEVCSLITNMVISQGHLALPALSLKEARAVLKEHHVDAVISDLELGDGTGFDLLADMNTGATAPLPMVMISSYASADVRQEARAGGAIDLLNKPFRLEKLTSALSELLRPRPDTVPSPAQ